MIIKPRTESREMKVSRILNVRKHLPKQDRQHFFYIEKGYEGEVLFDNLIEDACQNMYVLNDLLLEVNRSYFQIDSVLIGNGIVYWLDIKNYEGDYYYQDTLYSCHTGQPRKDPLDQLKRSHILFTQFLQNLNSSYTIKPLVIFINPHFTLYQAPRNQPMILPTQLTPFVRELKETNLPLTPKDEELAQTLLQSNLRENPFTKTPDYTMDELKKGIHCKSCGSFSLRDEHRYLRCQDCQTLERKRESIRRMAEEFILLFPHTPLTTRNIQTWCQHSLSQKTVARALNEKYTFHQKGKSSFYSPIAPPIL